ncbi:MAG TPA: glycosyltransferase family 2 protein [Ignavibacteriaceae bacterium]|nr:glycosyltransferase family 2 protein [Ignavibacteriaceae bacterium]
MEENKNENNNNSNINNQGPASDDQRTGENAPVSKNAARKAYYNRRKRNVYRPKGDNTQQQPTERFSFKKVSIVVPLFNEEESLLPLANEIRKSVKPLNILYEVIFVDDGSNDKSLKIIKDICRQDRRFRYISFNKNYGKSAALQIGFNNATGDVVITMDADLQDDPNEIGNLLKKMEEGYDLVSGWKKVRHDPFIKRTSSKFFNFATRIMSGIKIHDFNCGLKAYKKPVTENIKVYGELHRYMPVLADWQGFKVSEVPVKHHERRYGKTKFGISRFFKGFIDLVTVFFTTRYIKRPMHFFGFLGALSFVVGILVNAFLTYQWLFKDMPLSNRPLLFLGMLLIIVGIQFFSVGLLGEMLVHNSMDEKEYVIKDKG